MKKIQELKQWHKTKTGLLVFGLAELAIAYVFASLAIDSGSLWQYLLTLIFFAGSVQNLFKLVVKIIHGNKHRA